MNNKILLKWGGISALAFVVLFSISIATYWVTGGLEFRAWVPLFSSLTCFLLVATLAGYEYLSKFHYSLARGGLAFAALAILVLFLEAAVWGADRMVVRSESLTVQPELTHLRALFSSLHLMVLWFIGIWMAFWGAGFVRLSGRGKAVGVLMVLVTGFNSVDYLLARLGQTDLFVDLWHLAGQITLMSAFTMLGLLLLEAARVNDE